MAVGVISKVFRILEVIEASPSGLALKSICDITRFNKSTAHRFLKHLEAEGYLIRADGGKYLIGPKLSQMGARADHRATLQAVSRPILSELWKSTRETVNLGTLDQGHVLYIKFWRVRTSFVCLREWEAVARYMPPRSARLLLHFFARRTGSKFLKA